MSWEDKNKSFLEAVIFEQSFEGRAEVGEEYLEEMHTRDTQHPAWAEGPAVSWLGHWCTKEGRGK